jgi:hypothetical protein
MRAEEIQEREKRAVPKKIAPYVNARERSVGSEQWGATIKGARIYVNCSTCYRMVINR